MDATSAAPNSAAQAHRLDALLSPASIALVGASARADSNGLALVQMARIDGYAGRVYPVNPRYTDIEGLACYASLDALPERVDHVVLALSAEQLETNLELAIGHGARAVTMFSSAQLDADRTPPLAERLKARAQAAGLAVCGPNSMGFYNPTIGLRVAGFPSPPGLRRGGIVFIAQSGSAFSAVAHNDRRLGFALCMSSGMELTTTAADYVEWALAQSHTRVIGLFLEQIRQPQRFMAAARAASARGIPIVVLKVGRTARSAAMAMSHTGAMAGSDLAFVAMCRSCGVIAVDDLDEMAALLQVFDQPRPLAPGDLASIHDSGGERELVVDLAERIGVRFAEIAPATRDAIAANLDPGLVPDNPIDAWGTARDFANRYARVFSALVADPAVAAGVFFSDIREGYWYSAGLIAAVRQTAASATKPVMIATNYSKTLNNRIAAELAAEGIPTLEGTRESLLAIRRAFDWRDRRRAPRAPLPPPAPSVVAKWRGRLTATRTLDEHQGLAMLGDFGIAVPATRLASSARDVLAAAEAIGFPVALKTAAGLAHKSDAGGVHLALRDAPAVSAAYRDLSDRLGPDALVAAMAPPGVEVGLGAVIDREFGPIIVVAAGGKLIEVLDDKVAALAPLDAADVAAMLAGTRLAKLLAGVRGAPPADLDALALLIARFSAMTVALADVLAEIDVNPVIAAPGGAVAVDALIVSNKDAT